MKKSYKGIPINTSKNTHETVFQMISKAKGARIMDIPSGAGAFISRLLDNGYTNVLAVDIKNHMQVEHKDFKLGDMTKTLLLDDNSIDTLVCIDGIEHINSQADFVKEVHRVLKKDGEFIISTPNISSLRSRWKWFLTGHHNKCNSPLDENNPNPLHHISMISFPEIRYLCHVNGFKITEVATNRIKWVSFIYALFLPLHYLITSWVYYKRGKKEGTSAINKEIKKIMFSNPVLFGETLIVKGIKFSPNT